MNKAIIFLKTYLIFLFLLFSNSAFSQTICIVEDDADWRETRAKIINNIKDGPSDFKLERVNIHFMLRTNGTGNFTETGDNLGNSLTGYHFANDIIDACNKSLSYNVKMAIPPNNTTSVEPKNYQYILDGVFFIEMIPFLTFRRGEQYLINMEIIKIV